MTILFFSNIHFFIDQDQKVVCVHTPVVATIVEREIEYEQDTKIIMDGLLQNEALNGFVQHELVRRYMGRSNKNLDRILHQQDPDTQGAINIVNARPFRGPNTYTGRLQVNGTIDYGSLVHTEGFQGNEKQYRTSAVQSMQFLTPPPSSDDWEQNQLWYIKGRPAIRVFDTTYGGKGIVAATQLPAGTMIPYFGLFGEKHQAVEEQTWRAFLWERYQRYNRTRDMKRFYELYTGNIEVHWGKPNDIEAFKGEHREIFDRHYRLFRDEGHDILQDGSDQSYSHSVNVTIVPKDRDDQVWAPYLNRRSEDDDERFHFIVDPPMGRSKKIHEYFPGMYIASYINELSEDPIYGMFNLLLKFKREPNKFNEMDQTRLRRMARTHGGYVNTFLGGNTTFGPNLPFAIDPRSRLFKGFVGYVTDEYTITVNPPKRKSRKKVVTQKFHNNPNIKEVKGASTFLYSDRLALQQELGKFCEEKKIAPIPFSDEKPPITIRDFSPNAHFLPTCETILRDDPTTYIRHSAIRFPQKPVCYIMTTRTIDQGEEIVISYGYGNRQERSNDGKWWHCGQICYWNQDMAILNNDVGFFFDRPLLPDKRKREEDKRDEGDNAEPSEKKSLVK